ncbi:MAG: ElyC/SanA/YdcF family protein [bacterium]
MKLKKVNLDNIRKYLTLGRIKKVLKKILRKIKSCSRFTIEFIIIHKKKILLACLAITLLIFFIITILNVYYDAKYKDLVKNISDIESVDSRYTALVLGAGISSDGGPSKMLQDRLDTGYNLLKMGKVSKLILSGDNRQENYNEPEVMKNYLLKRGIPEYKLVADYAGRRTYDSCYRAKVIFGQSRLFVVTQDFHINRAVFLCKSMGIDTIGIRADMESYPGVWTNIVRDFVGMFGAFIDAKIFKPEPVLGDPIRI